MPFDWRNLTNGNTLFGTAPAGGVMGDETQAPNKDAMMALASQLLQGSGYSSQRTTFGQQAGAGLQAAMQARAQSLQDQQKAKYVAAQTQALQAKPLGTEPAGVQEYEFAKANGYKGSFEEWKRVASAQPQEANAIAVHKYFESLTPDRQKTFLETQRSPVTDKVVTVNGVPTFANPISHTQSPMSSQQSEIDAAVKKALAESQAHATGTIQGEIEGGIQKKGAASRIVQDTLDIADPLIDIATGSATGAAADKVAGFFGVGLDGAKATAQLKILQANLMQSQPRMEGPQSDADVKMYREAAGQLGDPTVPRDIKKASIETIRKLQKKYAENAAGMSKTPAGNQAPAAAIEYLRKNPALKEQFKAKYGYVPDGI